MSVACRITEASAHLVLYDPTSFPIWSQLTQAPGNNRMGGYGCSIEKDMPVSVQPVQLKPETVGAFDAYALAAEKAMDESLHANVGFLWSEDDAERVQQIRKGVVVAEYCGTKKDSLVVPHGRIHDLIGGVFVPERSVQQAVRLVQDYENHKTVYKTEVIDSKVISHAGDDFHIYLRLLKKKIITVVLDTYHDAHYSWHGPNRALCRSHSTQIHEVEHAGTPNESRSQADMGYGFLWRLYSYWRFEQKDGGVFIECRAISLTRDIPPALAWIIKPIVRKLPKESLVHTLEATRDALASVGPVDGAVVAGSPDSPARDGQIRPEGERP